MPEICRQLVVKLLCTLAIGCWAATVRAAEPVRFAQDILPILSDNCFLCHGPDPGSREAELRLDTQDGALKKEGAVIVPGQSGQSELIRRITSTDPDEVMPPAKTARKLSPQQIEQLRQWVDAGAPWGKHWAFEPPVRPVTPDVTSPVLAVRNPIDALVLARLAKECLAPSPEASKQTLIRRVTLDLTGLPPTPAEVDAFVADTSTDAYEKVVDRLLASPRFGERMVWEWLDAARYADTNGYQGDPTRTMHFWRDWVIAALNQNMPFDQFTIEQLAGDLLPSPTESQLIATGFHRNHMINGEGGRIAEESRVDYVQDRVETTGAVWLGLTLNCCRCHDHKFDALKQREYYQLSAYFNSIDESGGNDAGGLANPVLSLRTPAEQLRLAELREAEKTAGAARDALEKQLRDTLAEWEQSLGASAAAPIVWTPLVPRSAKSTQGAELVRQADDSVLAQGSSPATDEYVLELEAVGVAITGIKLETLPDDSLVNRGPGRADNGNYVLTELSMLVDDRPLALTAREADFAQSGFAIGGAVDGKPETGWAVMPEFGKTHTAVFTLAEPVNITAGKSRLSAKLAFQFGRQHTLGRFKLSATTAPLEQIRRLPSDIAAIAAKSSEQRTADDQRRLGNYRRDQDPQFIAAKKLGEDAKRAREAAEGAQSRTMIMRERKEPRETFILARGAYDKPGDKVAHGVPAFLPPLPADAPPNRLALARWLVSSNQPLTARVIANRYWQSLFGVGLVKTAEDFGVQGEKPPQAELLDWLACEFMQPTVPQPNVGQPSIGDSPSSNAWNVKHLLRLIVTSSVYRQSSKLASGMAERDPENRLLARGARFRLPSWMIRDQALAASGLLVEKIGGPAVKGYQPSGVWEEATFGQIGYQQEHGEALYRRSVYQFWRRIVGPTVFFDVANRQTCQVKQGRTNTPLHALTTLNDVTYVEASRALAQRLLTDTSASPAARIATAYRLILCREATAAEQQLLVGALGKLREQFAAEPTTAVKLLSIGESKRDETLDPLDHAAYTALCNAILNLDEALTKQ